MPTTGPPSTPHRRRASPLTVDEHLGTLGLTREAVGRWLPHLDERHRDVITRRLAGASHDAIGGAVGIKGRRARAIEAAVLRSVRAAEDGHLTPLLAAPRTPPQPTPPTAGA